MPNYIWVNDNGAVDIIKDGINIQQKFSADGNYLSLRAVKQHLEMYPSYLNEGGKYQIPKDHYDKINYLLAISESKANKMPISNGEFSLTQWKYVHNFFSNGEVKLSDIESSELIYDDVQVNKIHSTLEVEKDLLKGTDEKIRKKAYIESKPTVKEGVKVAAVSAAIEGGTVFVSNVIEKRKNGKKFKDFTENDWKEIFKATGIATTKGGVRGVSIYILTNYTATSAATASSMCTAAFGIAEQSYLWKKGMINEDEFIMNAEIACLDATVSALSSFIGQALIPIPVLGAVIGNTAGTIMSQIAKDNLSKYEIKTIIPFQIAYAVSIHKAQGLEYKSVKVIIPPSNAERITHPIFYTAITRAKENLKIYWSPETMKNVLESFEEGKEEKRTLTLMRKKLGVE